MPTPEQWENAYQAHLQHIRWLVREGGVPPPKGQVRREFSRLCQEAGRREEETRRIAGMIVAVETALEDTAISKAVRPIQVIMRPVLERRPSKPAPSNPTPYPGAVPIP